MQPLPCGRGSLTYFGSVRAQAKGLLYGQSDFAFAPDRLAAYAGPAAGFQVRQKFRQVSFVLGDADETADRVALAGSAAAAFGFDSPAFAARHLYSCGADAAALKIDLERSLAVEPSQSADAVANAPEQNREFGAVGYAVLVLELGRREKFHADFLGRRW